MKIGIQTWGSNGDIRPLLALAKGLTDAGHAITLVVSSIDNRSYQAISQQLKINYRQVPAHIAFDMEDFAQRSFKMHPLKWLRSLLDEAFFPWEQEIYSAAQTLVAENDFVIGHHFLYPLKLAAQLQRKPFYSVTFCHAAIPNPTVPPFGFPNLGIMLNPLSWKLLDAIFNGSLRKPLTQLWQTNNQRPPKNMLSELLVSQHLNLVAVDPIFCQGHEYWQKSNYPCGFLNLTEDAQHWRMPKSLATFLQDGPSPIYMTFGSLQQAVPEWSMDLFLKAVSLSGCRAIIQTSSADYPADSQQGAAYFIGKHPHQPIFLHCAAVVHHGGAGTTHAATRSGCPSIVVPFMDEQLFWGRQLQNLGLAGKPLPAKTVTARVLANAITETLTQASRHSKAKQASLSMQAYDGVATAVELLEGQYKNDMASKIEL